MNLKCYPLLLLLWFTGAVPAAEPEVESKDLPRIPPTEPEKTLANFRIKPGFRLELVAAEPLVVSPVAMAFDEESRLFVVEMRDYSERRPERLGRIRRFEDTDGDGRFDNSTVFADDLPWPTAVTCYDGGIFVGATPDIFYFKDTDGDGKADVQELIFTGFASDYAPYETNKLNVQALMNSFQWGLDNRIHGATGPNGGKVHLVDSAFTRAWVRRAQRNQSADSQFAPLDLRGRDFSFDPRTLELRSESGGGQHGMSFDNRGRKFICSNSDHIQLIAYEERYANRNSIFNMPAPRVSIAVDGPAAEVFRISPDEPWRVIRTRWRVAGQVPGPIEGGGRPSGYFTGATGATIYRGDAFGNEYVGDAFIADCGSNLVHRKKLWPDGVLLRAERAADEQKVEFLASSDNWFRPVQFANAPDGCLYIIDMYREVIEHPWSLPPSLKKHLDLNSGHDRGRIYRVVPENFKQPKRPHLGQSKTVDLVKTLDHPNGWHRDTAARLLYQRQDRAAIPLLLDLSRTNQVLATRWHVLYALHGLGANLEDPLVRALRDTNETVRVHALRLLEGTTLSDEMSQAIQAMLARSPLPVQFQFLLSLPHLGGAKRVDWLYCATESLGDRWVGAAFLNAASDDAAELFLRFSRDLDRPWWETIQPVAGELARLAAARAIVSQWEKIIANLKATRSLPDEVRLQLEASLSEGFRMSAKTNSAPASAQIPTEWFAEAARLTEDARQPAKVRVQAVRVLAQSGEREAPSVLFTLLEARHPRELQSAALAALARWQRETTDNSILKRWSDLSPDGRAEALELLLRRPERIRALLTALEQGSVRSAELSVAQQSQLRALKDPGLRDLARKILGRPPDASRQSVVDSMLPALKLQGSAANGQKLFQTLCASCHRASGQGHALGPDLVTVKNSGKEKLLVNILDPNREVPPAYLSYLIETKDGETLTGLVGNETAAAVTLRQANDTQTVVPRANIARMQSQGVSVMPEGLEVGLTAQDLADLLEFIVAP